jgi:hypothetical protein
MRKAKRFSCLNLFENSFGGWRMIQMQSLNQSFQRTSR